MNFDHIDTSKIHADLSPKDRTIDYDTYFALYADEESDPRNVDFYPTDPEIRKAYITQVWFGKSRMNARHKKIVNIWGTVDDLKGKGLELGFNWGGSLKWLLDRYPGITTLDGVDFSSYMVGNEFVFREVFGDRIGVIMEASCHDIPQPDGTYDFINSCSMFEHFPDCVYWGAIKECWRLLKPGGYLGVYLDKGQAHGSHLRMDPVDVTVKDLTGNGFERITDYLFRRV